MFIATEDLIPLLLKSMIILLL